MTSDGVRTAGPPWRVGDLARATGVTVRTLHHYEHLGLLHESARSSGGHRLYDEQDLQRLYRVRDSGRSTHFADAPTADLAAAVSGDLSSVSYTLSAMAADSVACSTSWASTPPTSWERLSGGPLRRRSRSSTPTACCR